MPSRAHMHSNVRQGFAYDSTLLVTVFTLLGLGLVMVASASMSIAERQVGQAFYYVTRQGIYLSLGLLAAWVVMRIDLQIWFTLSSSLLLFGLLLLVLVLIPGIGVSVNGSMRWLRLGPFSLQASEVMKLMMIIYMAGYLVRHYEEVRTQVSGFLKPMLVLSLAAVLLLMEPDLGATVVVVLTALGMMFLADVKLRQFLVLILIVAGAFVVLAVSAPYRLARMTSFLDPWADQFNTGYQLTQALIAFGRGEWFGVGLGAGIQKLFYLPEAHTDFLFAVIAEELGLFGVLFVISLLSALVYRAMQIGREAQALKLQFGAYVAYGIGLWLAVQALISIGVNAGMLPTKGLTLPLMSYGGSSLLITCIAIGLLCRVHYENQRAVGCAKQRRRK